MHGTGTRSSWGIGAAARRGLVLAAVTAALVAGCGPSSPEPTPSPTASLPEPTSTPTMPEPAPSPTIPAAMADRDVAGAEAAARHFLDLYPYTLSSQDTTAWDAMSYEGCIFCQSVSDGTRELAARGIATRGGTFAVESASVEKIDPSVYAVTLEASQTPEDRWDAGTEELATPGTVWSGSLYLLMYQAGTSWYVRGLQTLEPGETS